MGPFFFFFFFCDKTWQHFCWCCTSTEPTVSWFNSTSLYFQKSSSGLAGAAIKSSPNLHPAIEPRPNWMLSTSPKPSSQKICPQAASRGNHHTFFVIDSTSTSQSGNEVTLDEVRVNFQPDQVLDKINLGSSFPCKTCRQHGLQWLNFNPVHCQRQCHKKLEGEQQNVAAFRKSGTALPYCEHKTISTSSWSAHTGTTTY